RVAGRLGFRGSRRCWRTSCWNEPPRPGHPVTQQRRSMPMISPRLLSMLWCPACQASHLQSAASSDRAPGVPAPGVHTLICPACEARFPVQFGFPTLIPEDSLTGAEWQEWRDHLEKFRARRMARVENPNETIVKLAGKSRPQPSFAEFIRIDRGMVLDIG